MSHVICHVMKMLCVVISTCTIYISALLEAINFSTYPKALPLKSTMLVFFLLD